MGGIYDFTTARDNEARHSLHEISVAAPDAGQGGKSARAEGGPGLAIPAPVPGRLAQYANAVLRLLNHLL